MPSVLIMLVLVTVHIAGGDRANASKRMPDGVSKRGPFHSVGTVHSLMNTESTTGLSGTMIRHLRNVLVGERMHGESDSPPYVKNLA